MHIKVITTSASCIGYLRHNKDIDFIPDNIKYTKNEEYYDFLDVSSENFYNRQTYDKYASPKVFPQKIFYIKELINRSLKDGYDEFLFILPSAEIIDYKTNINLAMHNLNIEYEMVDTRTIGYPLAYLTIEAERLIKGGATLTEARENILNLSKNVGLILYSYNNEPRISLEADLANLDSEIVDKHGRLYMLENGRLIPIKADKKIAPIYQMLNLFKSLVLDDLTIPFISYTRATAYKRVLEESLGIIYSKVDSVKAIPLPSILGTRLGNNIIALGYIKR